MAVNSTSFTFNKFHECWVSTAGVYILVPRYLLLLPLFLLVLCLGYQRWRHQRSFATTSHSDIFTYHSAVLELIQMIGVILSFCGIYADLFGLMAVGYYLCSIIVPAQSSFHILTCVERYLAVIHPVIYLKLRQSEGVRIRNISIGCVWLLCIGWIGLTALYTPDFPFIPYFCILVLFLAVVSFFSLSVLCVLIRPGPGEMGGNRERVDQSKQRAFNTITAITGVMWLYFLGFLVSLALNNSYVLSYSDSCLAQLSGSCLCLPSSFILPLLFLQRAGKLHCCHCIND